MSASLPKVSLTSYILGILGGLMIGLFPVLKYRQFNIYMIALSLFHFLEYYVTAKYNSHNVNDESFLINNGNEYLLAHTFAILEFFIELLLVPHWKDPVVPSMKFLVLILGLLCIIVGQLIRTLAMYTAGQNFSHVIRVEKDEKHQLVTTGIYSIFRHPSYFGFFWWAVGTQLLLLNPFAFCAFFIVLWRFFKKRIDYEEKLLINFFGQQYLTYKQDVPIGIPFM